MHYLNHKKFSALPILLLLFFLYYSVAAHASSKFPKWGKVTKAEIELKKVPYDTQAHAVVLAKTGHLSFLNGKFLVKKYVRIKILDDEGIAEGDVALPYYSKDNLENIDQVKGQTLEILENGKLIKHSLEKKQVFDVQVDENWSEIRFALPSVKAGSIIEYSFNLYSENYTFLEGWVFQNHIPTFHSYFKAEVPEFLRYKVLMHGNRMVKKYTNSEPTNEWELSNLPALKDEPFTYNIFDYADKISFQLTSYDKRNGYNGITEEKVFIDWQSISQEVLSTAGFRSYLNSNKTMEEMLALLPREKDSLAYARKIYAYVQHTYAWNERFGLLPDPQLKDILQSKKGNGTAINLLLVGLLRKAGFDAHPTYLSTKGHGRVSPEFPFLSQFNHVIAMVTVKKKNYLLDAAGNMLAFGTLPVRDLNYKALALSKKDPRWININDQARSSTIISYFGNLTTGSHRFDCNWSGYDALKVAAKAGEDEKEELLIPVDPHLQKDSVQVNNTLTENNSLKASFHFSEKPKSGIDKIYLSLPLFDWQKENPLKNEVRYLPVDFGYTSSKIYVYNIQMPAGYTIEEKPENISMTTPGKEATFFYNTQQVGNNINVQIKLDIKESLIPVESYLNLRELYSKMINHFQKSFVLTKVQD